MRTNSETTSKILPDQNLFNDSGDIAYYNKKVFRQLIRPFIKLSDEDKKIFSPQTSDYKFNKNEGRGIYETKIPKDIVSIETPMPVEVNNVLKSGEVLEIFMEKDSNVVLIALGHVQVPEDTASLVHKIRVEAEFRVELAAYLLHKFDNDIDLQKSLKRRNRASIFNIITNPSASSGKTIPSREQVVLMALSKLDGTFGQEENESEDKLEAENGKPSQDSLRYAADKIIGVNQ